MIRALRPIFVLAITVAVLPGADDLQSVYNNIDKGAAGFKGLTADIHMVAHMDLINEDDPQSGRIAVKRPKPHDIRVRIDFLEPDQKQVLKQVAIAGTKAKVYYPKTMDLQEEDLGRYKGMVDQFLLLGFGSTSQDLRSEYDIHLAGQEPINGQPTSHLELTPKSKDLSQTFPRIELWISNATGLALQQKLYEKGGKDYHLATYSNMKLRPDLSDADVSLNVPKDAHRTKPTIK